MKNQIKYGGFETNCIKAIAITIAILFCSCHKEDADGYLMDKDSFVSSVISQRNLQLQLLDRLSVEIGTNKIVEKRKLFWHSYFADLKNSHSIKQNVESFALSEEDSFKLASIDRTSGLGNRAAIIDAIMQTDQDLIAIHVNATSSRGLNEVNLRNWAGKWLPSLTDNLNESQGLKKTYYP